MDTLHSSKEYPFLYFYVPTANRAYRIGVLRFLYSTFSNFFMRSTRKELTPSRNFSTFVRSPLKDIQRIRLLLSTLAFFTMPALHVYGGNENLGRASAGVLDTMNANQEKSIPPLKKILVGILPGAILSFFSGFFDALAKSISNEKDLGGLNGAQKEKSLNQIVEIQSYLKKMRLVFNQRIVLSTITLGGAVIVLLLPLAILNIPKLIYKLYITGQILISSMFLYTGKSSKQRKERKGAEAIESSSHTRSHRKTPPEGDLTAASA